MIRSLRDREAEKVFRRERTRKLAVLDAAESLGDLRVPPGNRLARADMPRKLPAVHPGEVTSEHFWLNLQARYDLEVEKDRLGRRLAREVRVLAPK